MTESERKRRGVGARLAMHDEALNAAFDEIEADIHTEWASAWTARKRERCHDDLQAIKRLRTKLAAHASSAPRD